MKKNGVLLVLGLVMILMTGCGSKFEPKENSVYIKKDGTIEAVFVEEINNADEKELEEARKTFAQEIEEYNSDAGEDRIVMESLTEEEGSWKLHMTYNSREDYEAYNDSVFFQGTVKEAMEAGYDFEGDFQDAKGASVDAAQVVSDVENQVVIISEDICIQTTAKIIYVSDNVTVQSKKLAKAFETSKDHLAYVIY